MKRVILTIMAALLLVGSISQAMLLDSMDDIVATGWSELRGTTLMQQSNFTRNGIGGSMKLAYNETSTEWDLEPHRHFHAGSPPVSPPPYHNQLDFTNPETNTLVFWFYKDADAGRAKINEVIVNDYLGNFARFSVPEVGIGWTQIVAHRDNFVLDGQDMLWSGIQGFRFWVSTWDERGTSAIYIDDLQLVPEPATLAVLGLGSLFVFRRRKSA